MYAVGGWAKSICYECMRTSCVGIFLNFYDPFQWKIEKKNFLTMEETGSVHHVLY